MDINTLIEVFQEKVRERRFYLTKCKTDEERKQWYNETLDRYRTDLEPYIWQYFMYNYEMFYEIFNKNY